MELWRVQTVRNRKDWLDFHRTSKNAQIWKENLWKDETKMNSCQNDGKRKVDGHMIRLTWWWRLRHGHVQLPVEQDHLCLPMMLAEWMVQSSILWFSDSAERCKSNWTALCCHNEKWPEASCKSNPRVSRGKAKGYSSMTSQSPDLNPAELSSYWRKTAQINKLNTAMVKARTVL